MIRDDPFGFGLQTRYKNTTYLYRADGVKLKKVHNYFSGRMQNDAATTTEYLDGFQYNSEGQPSSFSPAVLQFVPTQEGYYDFTKNKYIYQYKDLIGNIRLAFFKDTAGNAVVDRETDFYPFGLEFGGILNTNTSIFPNYTFAFQEQEKQQDTGWNSFKWRNYDPTMGRFFNVDPLSEDYAYQSHYNFSENSVVNARELEGLEAKKVNEVSLPDDPIEFAEFMMGGFNSLRASASNLTSRGINEVRNPSTINKYEVDDEGYLTLIVGAPRETTKEKIVNSIGDLATIGLAAAGGPEGILMAQGGKAPVLKGVEEIKNLQSAGRTGKQARLRELSTDPKLGKADKGWLKSDINKIEQGKRKTIRNPPGKDLAHERGREAAKGYSYEYSHLQNRKDHRNQHKYDNGGRKNKERPVTR